jgi:hypothetical protein
VPRNVDQTQSGKGLQNLLRHAAANGRIRRQLPEDRDAAPVVEAFALTPSERALLRSVTDEQLEELLARTSPAPRRRRRFLQVAVGWVGALLGAAAVTGCSSPDDEPDPDRVRGSRPDEPVTGIRPD